MGLVWRRSLRVGRRSRLNLSRSGVSLSHREGPVTITLYHRAGSLVIDVLDCNSAAPQMSCPQGDDESGRGLALVDLLASRCAWAPSEYGKHVWAEIALPMTAPAIRAAVLRRFFARRPKHGIVVEPETLTLVVA